MNQLDDVLLAFRDTVAEDDEVAARAAETARRSLRVGIAADPVGGRSRRRARRSGRLRRLMLVAAAASAIAAAAILAPSSGGGTGSLSGGGAVGFGVAPASAETVLFHAARVVSRQPWRPLAPGEWLYYHLEDAYAGPAGRLVPSMIEDEWLAGDGGARVVQYTGHDVQLIGSARAQLQSERKLQRRTRHFKVYTADPPWPTIATYRQVTQLSSNPGRLRGWIDRQAALRGDRGRSNTLEFIKAFIIDPRVPPQVAASLYKIIASIPRVNLVGPVRDPLGRQGIAIAFRNQDDETQIIFDQAKGRVLAIRDISLAQRDGNPPAGTIDYWIATSRQAVIHSDRELPQR
ncbi:hypothetical protein AYO39_01060 [Actinobacteria bacterium SCGC AG-212-D09]|nr:hypothetical protein AYO39_01060 [Actinobacteria bacterium SCGC AG-212-D09]